MPPHPLTKFEIQKYYQHEPRFNGVFSGDNQPKMKVTLLASVILKRMVYKIIKCFSQ